MKRDESAHVLYLVFNKNNENEAKTSNKFPKGPMEIRTTHAFAMRHYFGAKQMLLVKPRGTHSNKSIIQALSLEKDACLLEAKKLLGTTNPGKKWQRAVSTVATTIRRTVESFEHSVDPKVKDVHVPWRWRNPEKLAILNGSKLSKRTAWKIVIKGSQFVRWAQLFFDQVHRQCESIRDEGKAPPASERLITHDDYLKVAQLSKLPLPFSHVAIDEAQDMIPCQADLFWGPHQRHGKVIYLFGDQYQQIYRFRGAGDDFRNMGKNKATFTNNKSSELEHHGGLDLHGFGLTGSFRFGDTIAQAASLILEKNGLPTVAGTVGREGTNSPGP